MYMDLNIVFICHTDYGISEGFKICLKILLVLGIEYLIEHYDEFRAVSVFYLEIGLYFIAFLGRDRRLFFFAVGKLYIIAKICLISTL